MGMRGKVNLEFRRARADIAAAVAAGQPAPVLSGLAAIATHLYPRTRLKERMGVVVVDTFKRNASLLMTPKTDEDPTEAFSNRVAILAQAGTMRQMAQMRGGAEQAAGIVNKLFAGAQVHFWRDPEPAAKLLRDTAEIVLASPVRQDKVRLVRNMMQNVIVSAKSPDMDTGLENYKSNSGAGPAISRMPPADQQDMFITWAIDRFATFWNQAYTRGLQSRALDEQFGTLIASAHKLYPEPTRQAIAHTRRDFEFSGFDPSWKKRAAHVLANVSV